MYGLISSNPVHRTVSDDGEVYSLDLTIGAMFIADLFATL